MPTHDPNDPNSAFVHRSSPEDFRSSDDLMHTRADKDSNDENPGYETTDANVTQTAAFLVVLAASVAVVFVLAFGIGKLINLGLMKQDGPANKWSQMAGAKPANMESDPRIEQQQLQQMVKRFPTPRLQTDDGNMDVAQMHAREDMFLSHYSWVNAQTQVVRIPITRAMQILAQRGIPVENPTGTQQQAMFGDGSKAVTAPLTDGFARTGPELDMIEARRQRMEGESPQNTQTEIQPTH